MSSCLASFMISPAVILQRHIKQIQTFILLQQLLFTVKKQKHKITPLHMNVYFYSLIMMLCFTLIPPFLNTRICDKLFPVVIEQTSFILTTGAAACSSSSDLLEDTKVEVIEKDCPHNKCLVTTRMFFYVASFSLISWNFLCLSCHNAD